MDISELKQQSDLSFNRATAKKNALERARSRCVISYNNNIFMADAETINLVSTLLQRQTTFYILDCNQNPCEISQGEEFLSLLIQRNQEALNQYHRLYTELKKRN